MTCRATKKSDSEGGEDEELPLGQDEKVKAKTG